MTPTLAWRRTADGRRLVLSRRVAAPASAAWAVLTAVDHWPAWGPLVTGVDYPHERVRPGTSGRVQLLGAGWVPFRIETVTDERWTWTVWGRTPPAQGHVVESVDDHSARVGFELPLWAPWYLPVCALAMRRIARLATDRAAAD